MKKRINAMCLTVILAAIIAAVGAISVGAFGKGASANGQGLINEPLGLRTFSFSVVTKPDGTVKGQATLHKRATTLFFAHVDVNCLSVVGNTATVSGVVTNSSNPDAIGLVALFRVTDNGEGQGTSDQISGLYFAAPDSGTDCRITESIPQVSIEGGNIQVKP